MSASPARLAALWELDQRPLPNWPPRSLRRLRRFRISDARDIDLAENITQGVVKQLLTLQRLAAEYSGRSLTNIDVSVQKILAVAMYQMRALSRVPTHAIVDDAVEQAKAAGLGGGSGFVNAVLRKAAADRAAGQPPERVDDPAVRAEQETSVPRGVYARLARLYGADRALAVCHAANREPPMLARLIGTATLEQLQARGVDATPHALPGVVVLRSMRMAGLRELSDAGLCQPQDATSVDVIAHLDLQPGQRVLDRCAGRGTKTQQIVELAGPDARVVAMDPSESRLALLRTLLAARKITNVEVVNGGSIDALHVDAEFDRVLIDAPCSNSGVLARRPEARYHQDAKPLARIVELQRRILQDTAPAVAAGGIMLYATCSVWPEENDAVVDAFLRSNDRFEAVERRPTAPSTVDDPTQYHDGGYFAALRRRG